MIVVRGDDTVSVRLGTRSGWVRHDGWMLHTWVKTSKQGHHRSHGFIVSFIHTTHTHAHTQPYTHSCVKRTGRWCATKSWSSAGGEIFVKKDLQRRMVPVD